MPRKARRVRLYSVAKLKPLRVRESWPRAEVRREDCFAIAPGSPAFPTGTRAASASRRARRTRLFLSTRNQHPRMQSSINLATTQRLPRTRTTPSAHQTLKGGPM